MNVLIATIGNKDLQISNSNLENINQVYSEMFITNNESKAYSVIDKESKNSSFFERSKILYEAFDEVSTFLTTPIINDAIDKSGCDFEKIILVPSNQKQNHHQDTIYAALIIEKMLVDKYKVEIKGIEFQPNDIDQLHPFFTKLFESFPNDVNLYIGNAGGTPTTRTATHLAGLFKDYRYLTLVGSGFQSNSFRHIEKNVVQNMLVGMLEHYDYEGIKNLPNISKEIVNLSDYAISRLNLDVNGADRLKQIIVNQNADIKIIESYSLLRDIVTSARIKYEQAAYPDFLWRLFTFHDNYLKRDVENILRGEIIFDPKNMHKKWNTLIKNNPDIKKDIDTIKINKGKLDYSFPNKFTYYQIVRSVSHQKINTIDIIELSLTELGSIRNSIAHNMGGLNRKMIRDKLSKTHLGITNRDDRIDKLFEYIYSFIEVPHNDKAIFENINEQILKSFNSELN